MLGKFGRWIYRRRWATLIATALMLLGSIAALARGGTLTTGNIANMESGNGLRVIEQELRQPGGSSFTIIFHNRTLDAREQPFRDAMTAALAPLRADRRVVLLQTPYDPSPLAPTLISRDGHYALATVGLRDEGKIAAVYYPAVRGSVRSPVLETTFTGSMAFKHDLDLTLEADLRRAELVSMPLALIVLLLVFGTLVASAVPVGVGGLAVLGGVAGVMLLSRVTDVAQYSLNIVTLIGLGVAIDYSLFIVSRYREELDAGATVEDAVSTSLETAGRAVAFSGLAVGIGLSGLLFYTGSYLSSIGMAGAIVVVLAVIYAVTFLPALLSVLGHKINWGRVPLPKVRAGEGIWHSIASWVMKRPVLVLLPTLVLMLWVGSPFLRLRMASADITALPTTAEARRGHEVLRREFHDQVATRVLVVAQFPTAPALNPDRAGALYDLSRRIAAMPNVRGVQSAVDLDPRMDRAAYMQMYGAPAEMLPPPIQGALRATTGGRAAMLVVLTPFAPASTEARNLVRNIRRDRAVADGRVMVTGQTAYDVDTMDYIVAHTPMALGWVMLMTYAVLFMLLGSVILPLKAVLMNLLSITGSFGALVWIFQDGHLSGLLDFTPAPVEPALPVILFCTVFGLSMDYEVLLLSRMQEEYIKTRDNTRSVAEGLEKSGRLITSAAAIMVAVFAAFALAKVVLIKAIGLGMAVAVALDATIVRVLIVPATMRLFGDFNWWPLIKSKPGGPGDVKPRKSMH